MKTPHPDEATFPVPLPAGVLVSWLEIDLLLGALRDAGELRVALAVAELKPVTPPTPDHADVAARYALLAARLGIARNVAVYGRRQRAGRRAPASSSLPTVTP